jgi:hypothetical protein
MCYRCLSISRTAGKTNFSLALHSMYHTWLKLFSFALNLQYFTPRLNSVTAFGDPQRGLARVGLNFSSCLHSQLWMQTTTMELIYWGYSEIAISSLLVSSFLLQNLNFTAKFERITVRGWKPSGLLPVSSESEAAFQLISRGVTQICTLWDPTTSWWNSLSQLLPTPSARRHLSSYTHLLWALLSPHAILSSSLPPLLFCCQWRHFYFGPDGPECFDYVPSSRLVEGFLL